MNILFLCTYPIKNPKHGGQLRVRNIVDKYLSVGYKVEVVGVLGSDHYEPENNFLDFPGLDVLKKFVENPFLMEDYAIGQLFTADESRYQKLISRIKVKPDIIHIEHPWFYALAERYSTNINPRPRLVYSSHNVECNLKNQILLSYSDKKKAQHYFNLIKNLEINAIKGADAVVAVSENDANWILKECNVKAIVAPNGVKLWNTSPASCREAVSITGDYRFALYCASAHPPNITGFYDMFGDGFGSLKPDEKIVIAGAAGWTIAGDDRLHKSAKLSEKLVIAGIVSQSCLEGLLNLSHCIVLPITHGGGTNLKTAEALFSGKYVIGTSVAMRGFENFIGQRGVHIADEPAKFKSTLREVMNMSQLKLSSIELELRKKVLWENTLSPLVPLIEKLKKIP